MKDEWNRLHAKQQLSKRARQERLDFKMRLIKAEGLSRRLGRELGTREKGRKPAWVGARPKTPKDLKQMDKSSESMMAMIDREEEEKEARIEAMDEKIERLARAAARAREKSALADVEIARQREEIERFLRQHKALRARARARAAARDAPPPADAPPAGGAPPALPVGGAPPARPVDAPPVDPAAPVDAPPPVDPAARRAAAEAGFIRFERAERRVAGLLGDRQRLRAMWAQAKVDAELDPRLDLWEACAKGLSAWIAAGADPSKAETEAQSLPRWREAAAQFRALVARLDPDDETRQTATGRLARSQLRRLLRGVFVHEMLRSTPQNAGLAELGAGGEGLTLAEFAGALRACGVAAAEDEEWVAAQHARAAGAAAGGEARAPFAWLCARVARARLPGRRCERARRVLRALGEPQPGKPQPASGDEASDVADLADEPDAAAWAAAEKRAMRLLDDADPAGSRDALFDLLVAREGALQDVSAATVAVHLAAEFPCVRAELPLQRGLEAAVAGKLGQPFDPAAAGKLGGGTRVSRDRFQAVLSAMFFFSEAFSVLDRPCDAGERAGAAGGIDEAYFREALPLLGLTWLDAGQADAAWTGLVQGAGGGGVPFDDFCIWVARTKTGAGP
jgi:hypothetical protein